MAPTITITERNPETWEAVKYEVPITYWFDSYFSKLISGNDDRTKKYKEELFGAGQMENLPPLYSDYSLLDSLGVDEEAFNKLKLHTRARIIVYRRLSNLVELYGRHKQLMKEKMEKRGREAGGSKDKPSQ